MSPEARRALQLNAAFLQTLARRFALPDATVLAVKLTEDSPIERITIGEALDLADKALAAEAAPQ